MLYNCVNEGCLALACNEGLCLRWWGEVDSDGSKARCGIAQLPKFRDRRCQEGLYDAFEPK